MIGGECRRRNAEGLNRAKPGGGCQFGLVNWLTNLMIRSSKKAALFDSIFQHRQLVLENINSNTNINKDHMSCTTSWRRFVVGGSFVDASVI